MVKYFNVNYYSNLNDIYMNLKSHAILISIPLRNNIPDALLKKIFDNKLILNYLRYIRLYNCLISDHERHIN